MSFKGVLGFDARIFYSYSNNSQNKTDVYKKKKLKKTDLLPIAKIRQNKIKKHIQTTVQLK